MPSPSGRSARRSADRALVYADANTFKAKYEECQAEMAGGDAAAEEDDESDDDDL